MKFRRATTVPQPANDDEIEAIRTRSVDLEGVTFEVKSHHHPMLGCRCLTCNIYTGVTVTDGTDCDEHPEAKNASDGGCLQGVISAQDNRAALLVASPADVRWLLAEVDRLRSELAVANHDLARLS